MLWLRLSLQILMLLQVTSLSLLISFYDNDNYLLEVTAECCCVRMPKHKFPDAESISYPGGYPGSAYMYIYMYGTCDG